MTQPKRIKLEKKTKPSLIPILADNLIKELPLIDVYVGIIKDPKTISTVVVNLNSLLPIPELIHLKRVRGRQILLFPKENVSEDQVLSVLKEKGFDVELLEDNISTVAVAKIPALVRKQYDSVHKLWPCNFHSDKYLEKLSTNTLFTETELEVHAKFMEMTIDVCKITGVKNGVVVVDPKINSVVAFGFDQSQNYPTKHAVMIAIDNVARTQNGSVWEEHPLDKKIKDFIQVKYNDIKIEFSSSEEGPYLCTGYFVYTIREPCITCAMALIHSRAKRVFYGVKQETGALGSLCKIHCVENMNHHYEAFAGLLEEECKLLQ